MIITVQIISALLCFWFVLFGLLRLPAVLRDLRDTYHTRGLRVAITIGVVMLMLAVIPVMICALLVFYLPRLR